MPVYDLEALGRTARRLVDQAAALDGVVPVLDPDTGRSSAATRTMLAVLTSRARAVAGQVDDLGRDLRAVRDEAADTDGYVAFLNDQALADLL